MGNSYGYELTALLTWIYFEPEMRAMKKLTIKQLEKRMADGYAARNELDARKDSKLNKANAALVGTCQKFHNSYGDGDKWWLYRRILSVDGMWCNAFRFQLTSNGKIDIDTKYADSLSTGWLPCSESEYNSAWEALEDAMYSAAQKRSQSSDGVAE
jgi:hypothetical protein